MRHIAYNLSPVPAVTGSELDGLARVHPSALSAAPAPTQDVKDGVTIAYDHRRLTRAAELARLQDATQCARVRVERREVMKQFVSVSELLAHLIFADSKNSRQLADGQGSGWSRACLGRRRPIDRSQFLVNNNAAAHARSISCMHHAASVLTRLRPRLPDSTLDPRTEELWRVRLCLNCRSWRVRPMIGHYA